MQVWCEGHRRKNSATLQYFCFHLQETVDPSSSACAASTPIAKMGAREQHLEESLFPINKCVHVLSHRRRRGWQPRGRRGQKQGILEWGNWSGSRKRYATPAYDFFSLNQVEWTEFIWRRSSQIKRKLNVETVLYFPPEQLNLYSVVLQKSS